MLLRIVTEIPETLNIEITIVINFRIFKKGHSSLLSGGPQALEAPSELLTKPEPHAGRLVVE